MATLKFSVSLPSRDKATLARDYEAAGDSKAMVVRFGRVFQSLAAGNEGGGVSVTASVLEQGTQATGTVTFGTVAANSTITVNGVVFTGKTSAPSGAHQFLCGVSASADAAAFAAIFNAIPNTDTKLYGFVTAAAASGVVTLTSADFDYRANLYTLASSDGTNLAVSGANFTGGAPDSGSVTITF